MFAFFVDLKSHFQEQPCYISVYRLIRYKRLPPNPNEPAVEAISITYDSHINDDVRSTDVSFPLTTCAEQKSLLHQW